MGDPCIVFVRGSEPHPHAIFHSEFGTAADGAHKQSKNSKSTTEYSTHTRTRKATRVAVLGSLKVASKGDRYYESRIVV